jgi:hypothetical protein
MSRAFYSATIEGFLAEDPEKILGALARACGFAVEGPQGHAWDEQIRILKDVLPPYSGGGSVFFEYAVPRLGRRIDVVLIIQTMLFILEFKVGEKHFAEQARDQVSTPTEI